MLIHRQLEYLLQQHGLEAVAAAGQPYDANIHEALVQEHHESVAEGVVIAEVQRGYKLHGRLLRPALVRVSQGPAASPEEPATLPDDDGVKEPETTAEDSGTVA